jgi:hypothetical protein
MKRITNELNLIPGIQLYLYISDKHKFISLDSFIITRRNHFQTIKAVLYSHKSIFIVASPLFDLTEIRMKKFPKESGS